ncbi:MAG: TrkA family potassium uptake protein [Firmicutes bacterium]|nr:TrkA family potassium uptake protein [Candidatus Fermentithermobacillaceae bacterium]
MYGIIVGCGRLGSTLALFLSGEGHDVVVIDKDPASFRRLGSGFNGRTITGTGIDEDVLRRAGIEKADFVVLATSSDAVNLMAGQVARKIFGVKKVIARIFEPEKEEIYRDLEIEAISFTRVAVREIVDALELDGMVKKMSLGAGAADLVTFRAGPKIAGKTCADISIPRKIKIVSISRQEHTTIAEDGDVIKEGDFIAALVRVDARELARDIFGIPDGGGM